MRQVCGFPSTPLYLAELNLLLVSPVGGVPEPYCQYQSGRHSEALGGRLGRLLKELLDQVDVRHDHAAAAVTLEAELVHRIAVALVRIRHRMEAWGSRTHQACPRQ